MKYARKKSFGYKENEENNSSPHALSESSNANKPITYYTSSSEEAPLPDEGPLPDEAPLPDEGPSPDEEPMPIEEIIPPANPPTLEELAEQIKTDWENRDPNNDPFNIPIPDLPDPFPSTPPNENFGEDNVSDDEKDENEGDEGDEGDGTEGDALDDNEFAEEKTGVEPSNHSDTTEGHEETIYESEELDGNHESEEQSIQNYSNRILPGEKISCTGLYGSKFAIKVKNTSGSDLYVVHNIIDQDVGKQIITITVLDQPLPPFDMEPASVIENDGTVNESSIAGDWSSSDTI